MNTTHILLKFIYIIKNTRQNDIQIGRVYFHQTTLNPPPHTDNSSSTKVLSNFISIHNQSLQNPITRRNHPRIRIPRASPDALVEQQKTIHGRGRPLDEPTESEKFGETDEKRLARILTTKESWSEQQKKTLDSGGNLLVAFFQRQKKKLKKKYSNDKY